MADYIANFNSNPYGAGGGGLGGGPQPLNGNNVVNLGAVWAPTQYQGGSGLGGAAGMQAVNPALGPIGGFPQAQFTPPTFTNSMSPDSWNAIAAGVRANANPTAFAGDNAGAIYSSMAPGDFSGGSSASFGAPAYGLGQSWEGLSDPGPNSSAWDPQNTAYNMIYRNQISPELGTSNLNRLSNYVNNTGLFANPQAGQAMGSVSGAESSGNPFARNPSSAASGMFQWLNTRGSPRATNATNMLGGNFSPEAQGAVAVGEILGGGYPGVYGTLNNPNATLPQMQASVINQFEGLQGYPSQASGDVARASAYGKSMGKQAASDTGHGGGHARGGYLAPEDDPTLKNMADAEDGYGKTPYVKLTPMRPDWRQEQDLHDEGRPVINVPPSFAEGGAVEHALGIARRALDKGGDVEPIHKADGGALPHLPELDHPPSARHLPGQHTPHRAHKLHVGPIHSVVAGRTDHLPTHVPSGSYVIPADIVSAMGEGNTAAGFKVMKRVFSGVPYSGGGNPYGQGALPYGRKDGGSLPDDGVPCVVAGGEYVIPPHHVAWIGKGDKDAGHRVLDDFVLNQRASLVKTLKKLPPPKKD